MPALKSKTSLKSSKSKSPKKSTSRYGKKNKLNETNTSRLSQKSVETGDAAELAIGFSASYAHIGVNKAYDSQEDPGSPNSRPKTTEHADKPRKLPSVASRSIAQ